jgi:D-tagatose-1,6-bisphosphate aldolase subunit GatZ/KbaZ
LATDPQALIQHRIYGCLAEYARACVRNRAGLRDENANSQASVLS